MSLSIYGKLPGGRRLKRIQASPNYRDGAFLNLSKTETMAQDASFLKIMREVLNKPANVHPPATLPSVKTNLKQLPDSAPVLVWFGHSSYLLKINGQVILVDPVFSGNAAPISFMMRAFKGADAYTVDDLPQIDLLLVTHDHYDHLDYKTILQLKHKVKQVCCSLGVGSHLEHWGIAPQIITELDWWESCTHNGISLIAAPARHFSGRGLRRGQTLWSSFILKTTGYTLLLGGDSGYDTHFKKIGAEYGPFDLVILESGQYNTSWPNIHMMPEETVQAAVDLNAKLLLPVHWGKFPLAVHPWNEPVERVLKKAKELNMPVTTPLIGEPLILGKQLPDTTWWRSV